MGGAGLNKAFFSAGNCLVKIWVKFLVKNLVKQNNRNNSIHRNNKAARAPSARAPLLFLSPLLFLLICLTQILIKKLTHILTKQLPAEKNTLLNPATPRGRRKGGTAKLRPRSAPLAGWLAGWLADWLAGWLAGLLPA